MKFLKVLLYLLIFNLIVISGFGLYMYRYFTTSYLKDDIFVIIENGVNFHKLVDELGKNNIINSHGDKIFYYTSKVVFKNKITIKAGEYKFLKDDTPLTILKKLKNGNVFYRKVTFAEGLTNNSIFKIINTSFGLFGEIPNNIPEGSLLPETYLYTYGETKDKLIERMQKAMDVFIDRGVNSSFEQHMRLGDINSLTDLEKYGNGYFKIKED